MTLRNERPERSRPRLPEKMILAAHEEYVAGASLQALGEKHWQSWACPSASSATALIRRAFEERGFPIRRRGRPRTSGNSDGRATPRERRRARFTDRDRQRFVSQQEEQLKDALKSRRLSSLVEEQKRDESRVQIQSRYVLSLDAATFEEGDAGDILAEALVALEEDETVGFVYTVSRAGSRSWDGWIERLCDRIDEERLHDEIASSYQPQSRYDLHFERRSVPADLDLYTAERGRTVWKVAA